MNEIPNTTLLLVVIVIKENHLMLGILNDDGSSCNVLYTKVFTKLRLHDRDIISYEGKNVMAFKESTTRLCGAMELLFRWKELLKDC